MNKAQACLHESSSEQSDRWCLSELFIYLQSACDREGLKGRCREEVCCAWGLGCFQVKQVNFQSNFPSLVLCVGFNVALL